MKKNDWLLLCGALSYSLLFYRQDAGINFLLFSLIASSILLVCNRRALTSSAWLTALAGTILSASCVFLYGNTLSVIANIISLLILSAYTFYPASSLLVSLLISFVSVAGSYVFMILDWVDRKVLPTAVENKGSRKWLTGLVLTVITLFFFFLYKSSNPLFDNLTDKITLDFISPLWLLFTATGVFIFYGLIHHRSFRFFRDRDERQSGTILSPGRGSAFGLTADAERKAGMILLLMLNALLLVVNFLDVSFLFDRTLPQGLTYSEFVHQGTGALITSIIIAISIILYFFRGQLNFIEGSRSLRALAALWILQNILMICSTAMRNGLYIQEYSLTYKRIGVFVWLLLAVIGLITTFIKVYMKKSGWYLFRINGWLFYSVLILSCLFNWDVIVTDYNISSSRIAAKSLDKSYLLSLSERNVPQMLDLRNDRRLKDTTCVDYSFWSFRQYGFAGFENGVDFKLYNFLKDWYEHDWRSRSIASMNIYKNIGQRVPGIRSLELENRGITSLSPLLELVALDSLNISGNQVVDLYHLASFPKLSSLHYDQSGLDTVSRLPGLPGLQALSLRGNPLVDLAALRRFKDLIVLDLSESRTSNISTLPALPQLKNLVLDNVTINSWYSISRRRGLRLLSLSGSMNNRSLPVLPELEVLNISNNSLSASDTAVFHKLPYMKLRELNISGNSIENLFLLSSWHKVVDGSGDRDTGAQLLNSLEALDISNNNIKSLTALEESINLTKLNAGNNPLVDISALEKLRSLRELLLGNCAIRDLSAISNLAGLERLDLANMQCEDLRPLYGLKKLRWLNAGHVTRQQLSRLQKALPSTEIIYTLN